MLSLAMESTSAPLSNPKDALSPPVRIILDRTRQTTSSATGGSPMQLTQKKKIRSLAVLTIAIASLGGTVAFANFADDWASNMTTNSTSASFYQGSQRGYFTGGSFSARWKQSNDNLVTISKPRIKSGCGGIDAFLGGFSFLDTDYLVNKLQRILSAAPAAAFDIALKTLAPQVSIWVLAKRPRLSPPPRGNSSKPNSRRT